MVVSVVSVKYSPSTKEPSKFSPKSPDQCMSTAANTRANRTDAAETRRRRNAALCMLGKDRFARFFDEPIKKKSFHLPFYRPPLRPSCQFSPFFAPSSSNHAMERHELLLDAAPSQANALRRALTADLTCIAPERVTFEVNTTCMSDEFLALRIGLIPFSQGDGLADATLDVNGRNAYARDLVCGGPRPVHGDVQIMALGFGNASS